MSKKKNTPLDNFVFPRLAKEHAFNISTYASAPEKCANVVVINHKYTYQGIVRGHAKQDGLVKHILVDSQTLWRGHTWESVHDVFEVD